MSMAQVKSLVSLKLSGILETIKWDSFRFVQDLPRLQVLHLTSVRASALGEDILNNVPLNRLPITLTALNLSHGAKLGGFRRFLLPNLTQLELSHCALSPDLLHELVAAAPHLTSLEPSSLRLDNTHVLGRFNRLQSLACHPDLFYTTPENRIVANLNACHTLTHLTLSQWIICDLASWAKLAEHSQLISLNLSMNPKDIEFDCLVPFHSKLLRLELPNFVDLVISHYLKAPLEQIALFENLEELRLGGLYEPYLFQVVKTFFRSTDILPTLSLLIIQLYRFQLKDTDSYSFEERMFDPYTKELVERFEYDRTLQPSSTEPNYRMDLTTTGVKSLPILERTVKTSPLNESGHPKATTATTNIADPEAEVRNWSHRLPSDLLFTIGGWVRVEEFLTRCVVVCRAWKHMIYTMPSQQVTCHIRADPDDQLRCYLHSPTRTHVTILSFDWNVSPDKWRFATSNSYLSHITELRVRSLQIEEATDAAQVYPPKLRSLTCSWWCIGKSKSWSGYQREIEALSRSSPHLTSLVCRLVAPPAVAGAIPSDFFTSLAKTLTHLSFEIENIDEYGDCPYVPCDGTRKIEGHGPLLAELRTFPLLTRLQLQDSWSPEDLTSFVIESPSTADGPIAPLSQMNMTCLKPSDPHLRLIGRITSLQHLYLCYYAFIDDFNFLSELPLLHTLNLQSDWSLSNSIDHPPSNLVPNLMRCQQLQDLTLYSLCIHEDEMRQLLLQLTQLRRLNMQSMGVTSLKCFDLFNTAANVTLNSNQTGPPIQLTDASSSVHCLASDSDSNSTRSPPPPLPPFAYSLEVLSFGIGFERLALSDLKYLYPWSNLTQVYITAKPVYDSEDEVKEIQSFVRSLRTQAILTHRLHQIWPALEVFTMDNPTRADEPEPASVIFDDFY